jgi:hypothetical protein
MNCSVKRKLKIASLFLLAAILAGCTTISNQYAVSGNGNNTFQCDSTAAPDKKVDTSLGASVSATAAASQTGQASNSGSSESRALR